MVDYYETDHYIFTHGWIPCTPIRISPYNDVLKHLLSQQVLFLCPFFQKFNREEILMI